MALNDVVGTLRRLAAWRPARRGTGSIVDARFARGYFCEPEDGAFDRKLRPGVAPTSNAVALLVRAGYPRALIAAVERRVHGAATT